MDVQTRIEVTRRLRSVEGHIRGVAHMVETDQPCMAILHQMQAVQGSLKQISLLLLASHLDHCLQTVETAQSAGAQQQLREELTALFAQKT
jgi:DNA-binding FrmR family transcriptional regulator